MSAELQVKIFFPAVGVAIFFLLCFGLARSLSNPLTLLQKRMLAFGTLTMFGVSYLITWHFDITSLTHSNASWIIGIAGWAILSWVVVAKISFRDPNDDQQPN